MRREEFAARVASGLSGWFQQLAAQDLEDQVGEDAAKVEAVRIIGAQRRYSPATSARPPNWPTSTKKRIDLAMLGRQADAQGWYGALEIKWPTTNVDVVGVRQAIIEDCVRVAFAQTSNLCANFVVIGGTEKSLEKLFDRAHRSKRKEAQRQWFCNALSRDVSNPQAKLTNSRLHEQFPDFADRVPQQAIGGWSRRVATELVSQSEARVGADVAGHVFVWQCKK